MVILLQCRSMSRLTSGSTDGARPLGMPITGIGTFPIIGIVQRSTHSSGFPRLQARLQCSFLDRLGSYMSENWKQWQGHNVADGIPLKEYLGGSETTAVYLTSYGAHEKAAVKLFAGGPDLDSRLASLRAAAKLSHPSLLKIFAT